MRRALILLVCAIGLSGCGTIRGWFTDDEPVSEEKAEKHGLKGTRIDIIADDRELTASESLKDEPVTLPDTVTPTVWPQSGGAPNHYQPNLAGTIAGDKETASAGKGEEWTGALVPSPIVGDSAVFAMDGNGYISAHERRTLGDLWTSGALKSKKAMFGGGLATGNGRVYGVSGGGNVTALDAATGKKLWERELYSPVRAAPLLLDSLLVIVSVDSQLFALDPASGLIVWQHRGINEAASLLGASVPAATGPLVITAYNSGELYALSRRNGNPVWNDSLLSPVKNRAADAFTGVSGDPVIAGRFIYTVSTNGVLAANDLRSGLRAWEQRIASRNTPWVSGDYLFLLDTDDVLYCLKREDGRIKWLTPLFSAEEKKALDEKETIPALHGPYMLNGQLLVIDPAGRLLIVNAKSGALIDTRDFTDGVLSAPAYADGGLYVLDRAATLHFVK